MLDSNLVLNYTINPGHASSPVTEFWFVSLNGDQISLPQEYGVTINRKTGLISVSGDAIVINRTFHVRAFVNGIASNIIPVTIVPRPVTHIQVIHDIAYVNPNVTYQLSAHVNEDATNRRLYFSIDGANTQPSYITAAWGVDEYRAHYISFRLSVNVIPYATFRIYIESEDGNVVTFVELQIRPIYATAITSAVVLRNGVTPLDNRDDFPEALGNMAMVRPGETLSISAVNLNVQNATFVGSANWRIVVQDETFARAIGGVVHVRQLAEIHHQMSPINNTFVLIVRVVQNNTGATLNFPIVIRIFVEAEIAMVSSSAGMPNSQHEIRVNRANDANTFNAFTFAFSINGGRYSSFPDVGIHMRSQMVGDSVATPQHNGLISNVQNVLSVQFRAFYTAGTRFTFELGTPGSNNAFTFTLVVNSLIIVHEIAYINYVDNSERTSTTLTDGSTIVVENRTGRRALVNGVTTYADLHAGNSVEVVFGNRFIGVGVTMGANLTLTRMQCSVSIGSINGNRITMNTSANDGQIFRFRLSFVDGIDVFTEYFYIRAFRRFSANAEISFRDGAQFIEDRTINLNNRVQIAETSSSTLAFVAMPGSQFRIIGNLLDFTSATTTLRDHQIIATFSQEYNNVPFRRSQILTMVRRFIITHQQLTAMGNESEENQRQGVFHLRANVTLPSNWIPINNFRGTLDGGVATNGTGGSTITFRRLFTVASEGSNRYIGVFRTNHGTIRNLNVAGVVVLDGTISAGTGWWSVGLVAGVNRGRIENVRSNTILNSEGSISVRENGATYTFNNFNIFFNSPHVRAGGIVGTNHGYIINSFNRSSVGGVGDMGGIAGANAGTISGSTNFAAISYMWFQQNRSVGGLVGFMSGGEIRNSRNDGHIRYINRASTCRYRQPSMGMIVGRMSGGTQISNAAAAGTVHRGTLQTISWTTGIWPFRNHHSHNQALHVGLRFVGRSN